VVKKVNLIERYEVSPFWNLIGIKVDSIEENRARIKLTINKNLLNGNKILHGGIVTSLLDAVMGINLKLNVGETPFATISLTSQFLKVVKVDETIYATAELIQNGRSVACMEARLINENDELISIGLGTFKINRPRS
jgi:acyl-coenzyme A thioesterase 13